MSWYAVQVWKNEEKYVARVVSPFVTEVKKFTKIMMVKSGKGIKCESVCMLPGYILIKADMTEKLLSTICSLPYVIHVITDSSLDPIKIDEDVIRQFERKIQEENVEQYSLFELCSKLKTSNTPLFKKNNNNINLFS
ncbi:transcription termination/antitermination protein NusG [Chengkuizengella axinellae]|uniref:Transcription termination/antitermination NusG family protein n=1 Tax=Chengkuizengella axinellae TaxID=3064388 RepID=A0ABT9J4L6_9BACL|nr:transcription termination/antitermination NusG family protein [Chengkuizengella sp. 2205SS18-9]MDP5276567.1 transcription termination/antitermination NusG family protein [Chengkuizengella sp. 2205SS18-9]